MSVTIKPAVLRDASWITANLRESDRHEAFCQLTDDVNTVILANWLLYSSDAFIAYLNNEPVFLFGTSPITACCYSVWGLGTKDTRKVAPAATRYFMQVHMEKRIREGCRTMEARSLATHTQAHNMMRAVGAVQLGEPFEYGKDGELFVLFRFTVAGYRAMRERRWSKTA